MAATVSVAMLFTFGETARQMRGEAEVEKFDDGFDGHHHVTRLQVAMHDAGFVSGCKRIGDADTDSQRILRTHALGRNQAVQTLPVDELHHKVIGTDVVEGADIRMVQGSDGPGLARKAV